jgi:hypothetical protein
MGVLPGHEHAGIGRALPSAGKSWLAGRDIEILRATTLSLRQANRATSSGGAPLRQRLPALDEMPELWGPDQSALQLIKVAPRRSIRHRCPISRSSNR